MSSCWRIDSISTVISWVVVASGPAAPNTHALRPGPPSQLSRVISTRMHGNLRYVKLELIGLLAALTIASPAQAEVVTSQTDRGLLAAAADGTPYAAYTVGRDLFVTV